MGSMADVYRAPMRSRSDVIDPAATLERARRMGLCGFGEPTGTPAEAERLARRVDRFAAAADGSFVWTRDQDGLFWLGRLDGPYLRDDDDEAVAADLVHVRPCTWLAEPLLEPEVPAAVTATFRRGGRNFQQTHHPSVSQETQQIWDGRRPER
ncbi:GAF domain-containing protein [Mycobacterium paragordonae]|nr:GAF domain-containing protein [Mycobacterium paragordonae]